MWARVRSFLSAVFRRSRMEDGMRVELVTHLENYAEDLASQGVPIEEARRRARVEFGGVNTVEEECRESVGLRWPLEVARDLRYAARVLRKSPAFTITAVVTLALCIGANTAIFSVVDSLILRPLPYPEPDRMAAVSTLYHGPGHVDEDFAVTGRTLEMLRSLGSLDVAAYGGVGSGINLVTGAQAQYVRQLRVTEGFFRVLGVRPAMGRELTSDEDRVGGPAAVILSHAVWMRLFQGDPGAIGRAVNVGGEPCTIVGIMPAWFKSGAQQADVWTPLRPTRTGEGAGQNYDVVARLRPGATWAQADSQVKTIAAEAVREMQLGPGMWIEMKAVPLRLEFTEGIRTPLMVLWAAVIVVLIIGCVNIAGLLLVRGAARTREIGTRMALGSGRAAVIRQLLSETVVLGVIGGCAGMLLGRLGLDALKLLAGKSLDLTSVTLDARVLFICAGASILTGLLFGIVPALQATRIDIRSALVEGGTRGVAGGRHQWTRRGLVVAEVALGVVLLVVAGLLIRTFAYLNHLDPGFDASNVVTAGVSLQDARYQTAASVNRLFEETLERIRALPGVHSAAVTLTLPYERALRLGVAMPDGDGRKTCGTSLTYVTPGYFEALRMRLNRGRVFTAADKADSREVALVNERFVRKCLGTQDALGIHVKASGTVREIVGVTGNVQLNSGDSEAPVSTGPMVYVPAAQLNDRFVKLVHTWFSPTFVVRTSGARAGIENALKAVDPQLPLASFRDMDEVVFRSIADQRFEAVLLSALAGLALLLAAVGIYGLIANSVVERTRELGIRIALGATISQAIRAVAVPGALLAVTGITIGCVLARAASGVVRHLVFGVRPTDPFTFAGAVLCLVTATVIAILIPALRVTRLNPADTLRAE